MQNLFEKYISSISSKFSYEETSEMGYRADFEDLLKQIFSSINNTHIFHDAKSQQGNKPDFIVLKDKIPLLYLEVKDIGISLDKVEKSDQMSRYFGYANLILSDYVEFRFYRNGLPYGEPIKIAEYDIKNRTITSIPEHYEYLVKTLVDFTQSHKEPIRSGEHLAKIMGGKAQRIRNNVRDFFASGSDKNLELERIYETIKKLLVNDLNKETFADMYAQTLVYGLFAARYYDKSPASFTRQEARDLIPATNPFLRHFFDHIIGPDFDKRLEYIVNELCEVFSHADVSMLIEDYFKKGQKGYKEDGPDPVIHFYEDFLKEYDPELRKKMGAYYTPIPVVNFIIKSVDALLKKEFDLSAGLADTTKLSNGLHRVQVLDPAAGTGTFISELIKLIYENFVKNGQKGRWPMYVHYDLLPRIYGFELMMAPYTISHLKIGITLRQEGLRDYNQRLGIYLTNSLEKNDIQQQNLFSLGLADSIAEESKEASKIKNERPIMIILGNPPYSGESSNAFYKENDVYKFEPTGGKLKEKNSKWLNDDYVKFIRFAENMIEKNGEGIVAMITAHGYIDNPTFRGMRWHLMQTFDEIYILDLHGNSNKKEKTLEGGEDQNIFEIKTGVSILFGIKKQNFETKLAKIYKFDSYGKRSEKFKYLNENIINSVKWNQVTPVGSDYEWIVRDQKTRESYSNGFSVKELFTISTVGIVTSRDEFIIDSDRASLVSRIQDFLHSQSAEEAKIKFKLKENQKWKVANALNNEFDEAEIVPICYRPFDSRYIYYDEDFIERSRRSVMKQFLLTKNVGLLVMRQAQKDGSYSHVMVVNAISDNRIFYSGKGICEQMPLYIYLDDGTKTANLNTKIVDKIEKNIGEVSPEDIFDYIYAVLYSSSYREKYKEFLKIDFPRVPYPKDKKSFDKLVKFGTELRLLHLLESQKLNKYITTYSITGSDIIEKVEYKNGNVYINSEQYFGNVPESTWNFYIGGYQPAQKWLKDRKGKTLTNEDIEHYQKMIVSLSETEKIMKKIDEEIKNI